MQQNKNNQRREFIKKTLSGAFAFTASLSAAGNALGSFSKSNGFENFYLQTISELDFRKAVIPRAQLSMVASQIALDKAVQKSAREFAGFELMEATAVIKVLKDVGTIVPELTSKQQHFLDELKKAEGSEFDKLYMKAELSNHEFLRDLAQHFLIDAHDKLSASQKETRHLATVALFAFKEHVAISKRICNELEV